jgi:hypothetical protein
MFLMFRGIEARRLCGVNVLEVRGPGNPIQESIQEQGSAFTM